MYRIFYLFIITFLFSIQSQAQDPPANNVCGTAIEIVPDSICTTEAFSTEDATESLPAGFWCAGNPDDDVWFYFIATKPRMSIQATGLSSFDATVQDFSGTCSNLNANPCADATGPGETEELLLENLIVGNIYYFRVFDRGSIANQLDFIFEICLVELDPLPFISFDYPCDAIEDTSLLAVDGTVLYFDNTGTTIDDNEFLITPPNGVCDDYDYSGWCSDDGIQNSSWGAFIAPASGAVAIDLCNDGQTEILTQLALYSYTDCNDFSTYTYIAGNETSPDCSMGSQLSTCNLTPGEKYLILVDGYQIATGIISYSITEIVDPNAGANASVDVCKNTPDYNLLDALSGADTTGYWIDVDATGNVVNGTFNAQNTTAGTYEFIYVVEGFTCFENDSSTVTVTTLPLGDAGESAVQLVCTGAGEIDLFDALGGTPETGGTWLDPNDEAHDGMFDPDLDASGTYTYIIESSNISCPQDSAFSFVETEIISGVDPGDDGTADVCTNDAPFDMISYIGGTPDEGGEWFDSNANLVDGIFDPASQSSGNFFYSVTAAGCGSDFSILTINVTQGPYAGASADSALCFDGVSVDMMTLLNDSPDAGGVWKDPSGNVSTSTFDPATSEEGEYWYVVSTSGCPEDSASVMMFVDAEADAGSNATSWTCYNAGDFFLLPLLGGTPQEGGEWTDPNGDPSDGFFNPSEDIEGEYTYTINGACDTSIAVLTVNVELEPHAGSGPSETDTIDVVDSPSVDLWDDLSNIPEPGGTWVDLNNSGNLVGSVFTPDALNDGITFTFLYVVNNVCGSDTAFVYYHVVNSVGIDEFASIEYSIYPNPVQDKLTIESSDLNGDYSIVIIDLSGREVLRQEINIQSNKVSINVNLPSGSYILSLLNKQQALINQSLIVQ